MLTRRRLLLGAAVAPWALGRCGAGEPAAIALAAAPPASQPDPTVNMPPAPPPVAANGTWSIDPQPAFRQGDAQPYDLGETLPPDVLRGGRFGVSRTGAPLPGGMTLTAAGLLFAGNAAISRTDNVVFEYAEP